MATKPDIEAQVVVMLEADYTMASVAKRLDLSLSTVKRIKKRRSVKAGVVTQEMIDAHRVELRKSFDEDWIKD
ncbi:helix-turn-helix domain-containing protein [Cobetia sp. 29-18-1]|uniref:helix-turn-helix domain-containing protein n=1 Tax=Cobetia sp. 29-18-1 TaxID=3040018 RepID=UPI00244AA4EB|nr:helix-turn-helix domain-containing protein [Cobetia sp. 29-18-1]MDH2299790.1 helix-turn-helix domain-containing protein [Cobetia sp. 29-18-1]